MSDLIRVSTIKETLTECPICNYIFDETDHLPRRMPCCVQSICHPCLEQIIRNKNLSCPLCRHDHHLPEGVASLPTEPLIIKILDHLKIQKGLRLPCTDCPDKNEATARCDDCCVFLCTECLRAHARHSSSRSHQTVTFAEMKDRPLESFRRLHQCIEHQQPQQFYCLTCKKVICVSCTVVEHKGDKEHKVVSVDEAHQKKAATTDNVLIKLDEKAKTLEKCVQELQEKKKNIQMSRERATEDVNTTFDNIVSMLETRRAVLLSEVELKFQSKLEITGEALNSTTTLLTKVKSSTKYTRQMRGKADKIEDVQLMVSSADTLNTMLEETATKVEFERTGVTFDPVHVTQLTLLMEAVGAVRTVTFTPTKRPGDLPMDRVYNAVTMIPADLPQVADADMKISGESEVLRPRLEWSTTTASRDITIKEGQITNTRPYPPPADTGCRIKSKRRALTSNPLTVDRGQRVMYLVKAAYSVKQVIPENMMIFETHVGNSPVDSSKSQLTGLSVRVVSCSTHKQQLCLRVYYDNKRLTDVPLTKNQVGVSRDLYLGFLLDRDKSKIHMIDVSDVRVISSVSDVVFDKPLWVLMCVDIPSDTDMRGELISGNKVTVTQEMRQLLSSLH